MKSKKKTFLGIQNDMKLNLMSLQKVFMKELLHKKAIQNNLNGFLIKFL